MNLFFQNPHPLISKILVIFPQKKESIIHKIPLLALSQEIIVYNSQSTTEASTLLHLPLVKYNSDYVLPCLEPTNAFPSQWK